MSKSGFHGYSTEIHFFIRFMDDCSHKKIRILDLEASYIREYINIYKNIPVRTATADYKISEIKKLTGDMKSNTTINDTFGRITTFLKYISRKGYDIDSRVLNVMSGAGVENKKGKNAKVRVPLTGKDLRKIFCSEKYVNTGKFYSTAMYWVPLLALFTGARMNELLQLQKADVKKDTETNIWIIDFNTDVTKLDKDKRLKEKGSFRKVPIHNKLIDLGFMDFVNDITGCLFMKVKQEEQGREERNNKGKFDAFEKRFRTYRKQVNVLPDDGQLKDFHSFRHTVRSQLAELGKSGKSGSTFDEGVVDAIVGHASNNRSQGEKTYSHSDLIKIKKMAIDQLEYPSIDFSKIKPWHNCDPWRKNKRDAIQSKKKSTK